MARCPFTICTSEAGATTRTSVTMRSGKATVWIPVSARSIDWIAFERGMLMRNVVPWAAPRDLMSITPPSLVTLTRATSIPTPRPEMSVTFSAVENPGEKMNRAICSSSVSVAGLGLVDEIPGDGLGQDAFEVDAAAVVADLDEDVVAALLGPHEHRGRPRLPEAFSREVGRLDAVDRRSCAPCG